jgi:hypothetical protein
MRLDPFIRDYPAFMDEVAEVLAADGTHFYLDTSLLMWLIRLGAKARAEFIAWCDGRPVNTVRVPVWAAHELHRHVISGTVRTNVQASVNETQSKYDEFARLASERADETICRAKGYAGRDGYIGELRYALARLRQLARVVDVDDAQLQQGTDEVIAFVNNHLLTTDIAPVVERLSHTGEFRYSHLMPPGFHDKKDENRYGDVIIWEELLEDLRVAGQDSGGRARHAILVSRDKKTDWVSAAPFVRNALGKAQKSNRDEELDVTLAHPLLVHEFRARAGGNRLYIAHPGFLASAIEYAARSGGRRSGVDQWLAASHRPDLLERLAGLSLSMPASASTEDQRTGAAEDKPEALQPVSAPEREGLEAVTVSDVMTPSVAVEVRSYQEARPHEHSGLIVSWVAALQDGSLSPFKVGRILAELTIAGAPRLTDNLLAIVEQLSGQVDRDRLNRVALAVIMSAYFDRYGELQRRPHPELGSIALTLETDPRLTPAFSTLNRLLRAADAMLPYTPGSRRRQVRFVVDIVAGSGSAPRAIRDIRVGEQSALADSLPSDSPRRLTALLGREASAGCSGLELRTLIAQEYLVPTECLNSDHDKKALTWQRDAGLVTLDTESEGGLSTLADVENEND